MGSYRRFSAGENGELYLKVTQATVGAMDLSRQEADSGSRYPMGKDLVGTHDWEAIWDWYRAADILEMSACGQGDLLGLLNQF